MFNHMNIRRIIQEEIDDLSWMDEVSSVYTPTVGDTIEVINKGSKQAYMWHLGGYSNNYDNGDYGDTISGTVRFVGHRYFELEVVVDGWPSTEMISFPIDVKDKGLHLQYIPH